MPNEGKREESSSFLKKRTKKLLIIQVSAAQVRRASQLNKSFLFLFFKKEMLPNFLQYINICAAWYYAP
jgi:hypothetical protein